MEALSHARGGRARRHLDPRRAGGDAGGRDLGRAQGQPEPAVHQHRCRLRQPAPISRARCWARSCFGWLTDRLGRKQLFFITLAVYLVATAATALVLERLRASSVFRFLTGAGIGGEYTAINSTIQELIPARYRGWTDLVINGSFWIGAAIGAVGSIVLLDPAIVQPRSRLAARLSDRCGARPRRLRHADVDFRNRRAG